MEPVQVVSDKEETIELYRVMVDTVIANEHRRQQISSVFITLIAAGFGAAGAIKDFELLYVYHSYNDCEHRLVGTSAVF